MVEDRATDPKAGAEKQNVVGTLRHEVL